MKIYDRKLNPSAAVIMAAIAGAAALGLGSLSGAALLMASTAAAASLAGRGRRTLRMALLLARISALFFVLQLFSIRSGTTIFAAGPAVITDEGFYAALLTSAKLVAASLPLMAALSAFRTGELTDAMAQNFRLPCKYAFALASAMRFIPALSVEFAEIREAQSSRGVDFDGGGSIKKISRLAPLVLPLLLSSLRRTEAAAISAQLRGFEYRTPDSSFHRYRFRALELSSVAASIFVSAAALAL